MSIYDKIGISEPLMPLLALITEFKSNSVVLPNYPLMPLGVVVLATGSFPDSSKLLLSPPLHLLM